MTALEAGPARALLPTPGSGCQPGSGLQPGSEGEHILQEQLGTTQRAQQFYDKQVVDYLTPIMAEFIQRMEMAFIATSDPDGECDCSFRAGPPGFIRVIDEKTIAYPELRGNGVMASMGNMLQNPHIGVFLPDFTRDLIGLHVNGDASIVSPAHMLEFNIEIDEQENAGKKPVQWVLIHVTEAYIHCSKHIPLLVPQSRVRHWGTDNPRHKGGDYFGVAAVKAEAGLIEPRRRASQETADDPTPVPAANGATPVPNPASNGSAAGSASVSAANGSASVPAANGSASVPAANGSASVSAVKGSAPLPTANGSSSIPKANGSVSLSAANGAVSLSAANGAVSPVAANGSASLSDANGPASHPIVNGSTPLAAAGGSTALLAPKGSALRPQCKRSASRPHTNGSSPPTATDSTSPHY